MEVFFPTYYHSFRCIADKCPDSCCKEWAVDVDEAAARYYRALPGDLGDRLRQVLTNTEDGTIMEIENGRCPMWRQDGLCRIQAELGHDALCQTCRDFPRLRHDYGDFMELSLELSCPEAARLILTSNGGMLVQAQPGGEAPDYDADEMTLLRRSRKEALDFLCSATCSTQEALAAILLYAHDVQAELDGAEPSGILPEDCLEEARSYQLQGDLGALFELFCSLNILTSAWQEKLQVSPVDANWSASAAALARYLFERYWLQAISDGDLICRVKFAIAACILVCSLEGNFIENAQLFSKEVENDPDNVEAILDGAYRCAALTDANLLGLLLG